MRSLRARLVAGLVVGVTAVLAVAGFTIYAVVGARFERDFDRVLLATARSWVPGIQRELLAERRGLPPPVRPAGRPGPPFPPSESESVLFQAWVVGEPDALRSSSLGEHELPRIAQGRKVRDLSDLDDLDARDLVYRDVPLPPDDRPGRAVGLVVRPRPFPGPHPGDRQPWRVPDRETDGDTEPLPARPDGRGPASFEVVVAAERADLDDSLARLRWLLVASWLATSVSCAAILSFTVHRGMRPLRELERQVEDVGGTRLERRFEVPDAPLELVPIVDELNELMGRMRSAFEREQAFTSDAAHELRTPLAGLLSTLEVALRRPRGVDEYREALAESLAIGRQMQGLVDDLLRLARAGATQDAAEVEVAPVGFAELLEPISRELAHRAALRSLTIERDLGPDLRLETDRSLFSRVIHNVLANAIDYADEGTPVRIAARVEDGMLDLTVRNRASSAPADVADMAFQAFWRADPSRSPLARHAGLGLALCQRIVERLGGTIEASYEDGWFALRVRLHAA